MILATWVWLYPVSYHGCLMEQKQTLWMSSTLKKTLKGRITTNTPGQMPLMPWRLISIAHLNTMAGVPPFVGLNQAALSKIYPVTPSQPMTAGLT